MALFLMLYSLMLSERTLADEFLPGGAWEQDRGIIIKEDFLCEVPKGVHGDGRDGETISAEGVLDDPFFDPRYEGLTSEVKDQGRYALCWDFAAVSTAESFLIKNGYDNSIDISEYHGAAITFLRQKSAGIIQDHETFEDFCNSGGTPSYIWLLWEEGYGPGLESDYPGIHTISENTLPDLIEAGRICDLSGILKIDGRIDEIKAAIRQGGAVTALYYSYALYYKDGVNEKMDSTYYMPYPVNSRNHAISIVGWDDDFPAGNFVNGFMKNDDGSEVSLPNGAWLCKNSWGKKAYKSPAVASGYYWISYYDRSLSDFTAISFGNSEDEKEQMTDDPEKENPVPDPYIPLIIEYPEQLIDNQETMNPSEYELPLIDLSKMEMPDIAICKFYNRKEKKQKTIKRKGVIYVIKGGEASVKKVTGKKKKIRIAAYIRYKGRKYPVTKICSHAIQKRTKKKIKNMKKMKKIKNTIDLICLP
ncbi:MAG: C1 family peptidase [Lachnospiraceae bacterium]|nr:C1 family peptidase [Lachnospiraceae bacterium]